VVGVKTGNQQADQLLVREYAGERGLHEDCFLRSTQGHEGVDNKCLGGPRDHYKLALPDIECVDLHLFSSLI
jgi:hypothetical protein